MNISSHVCDFVRTAGIREAKCDAEFKAAVKVADWFQPMDESDYEIFAGASDGAWIAYVDSDVYVVSLSGSKYVVQWFHGEDSEMFGCDEYDNADIALVSAVTQAITRWRLR